MEVGNGNANDIFKNKEETNLQISLLSFLVSVFRLSGVDVVSERFL